MRNIIITLNIIAFAITSSMALGTDSIPAQTIIKFSPLSLMNPTAPAIQFGIERKLSDNWTHQHEIGILWDGNEFYDGDFFGVRLQNELRYYIPRDKNFFDLFFQIQ